jgi:hypothetical protein
MTGQRASGWRGAEAELIIATIVVIAFVFAGYALAGAAGAAVVVLAAVAVALVVLRTLPPPDPGLPADAGGGDPGTFWSFAGYLRKRAGLSDGIASMASYDAGLRRTLEHLLAARLAERHGVSLYLDPDEARRLLCGTGRDADLWYWIDPAREAARAEARAYAGASPHRQPGIPPRTLARLIDRLEKL